MTPEEFLVVGDDSPNDLFCTTSPILNLRQLPDFRSDVQQKSVNESSSTQYCDPETVILVQAILLGLNGTDHARIAAQLSVFRLLYRLIEEDRQPVTGKSESELASLVDKIDATKTDESLTGFLRELFLTLQPSVLCRPKPQLFSNSSLYSSGQRKGEVNFNIQSQQSAFTVYKK